MKKPRVCILRTAGTNCDAETAFAFELAGAQAERVHVNILAGGKRSLDAYHILALPGGFSYGDDIAAGKVLANELRCKLRESVEKFIAAGKLVIGICNGFQILVKSGLLPGNAQWKQEASLVINDSGKFEARWVHLRAGGGGMPESVCVWTKGIEKIIYLPVAHGEGKFISAGAASLRSILDKRQVAVTYCNEDSSAAVYPANPNGSQADIAGICDETGRIFGLMPHPERHVQATQHPRPGTAGKASEPDGISIFKNGVRYAQRML